MALDPVADWVHYDQGYTSRILNGDQLDDEEAYRVSSPVYYADGIRDALQIHLVVHPIEDHGMGRDPLPATTTTAA